MRLSQARNLVVEVEVSPAPRVRVRDGGRLLVKVPAGDATVRCLSDGRWFDPTRQTWRDRRGRIARWPDLEQIVRLRTTRVVLAAPHLDHDPTNNRLRNLRSLCQRCHLTHDRPHHLAQRRITYLLRRRRSRSIAAARGSAA